MKIIGFIINSSKFLKIMTCTIRYTNSAVKQILNRSKSCLRIVAVHAIIRYGRKHLYYDGI